MNAPAIVFIPSPLCHFSPVGSGALSTWIYEVARCAKQEGKRALVLARQDERPAYEGIDFHPVPHPPSFSGGAPKRFDSGAK